jgi:hypothetical protein
MAASPYLMQSLTKYPQYLPVRFQKKLETCLHLERILNPLKEASLEKVP